MRLLLTTALCVVSSTTWAQFKVWSPDFKESGSIAPEQVFKGFGCDGGNVSPALEWSGAPKDTKSFALLVHDPDAPTGGAGWWHWVVTGIPADAKGLPKGAGKLTGGGLAQSVTQYTTDFGTASYGGPCPPTSDKPHRYLFTVYALKVDKLDLPANPTASLVGYMINANKIKSATTTGLFGRNRK